MPAREPVATPSVSPAVMPPYGTMDQGPPQKPGTIVFGTLEANGRINPFVGWPDAGLSIEYVYAFGAFWGKPVDATTIGITLYEVKAGTLHLVWTDAKKVSRAATGYLDTLVRFKRPGLYRLEVTRNGELLAWAMTKMEPPCVGNCSGG
jgi:hypothetical protein